MKISINNAVNQVITAFKTKIEPSDHQIQTSQYARFIYTPSVTPQLFPNQNSNTFQYSITERSPHRSPSF